ncbi:MAG: hypothetical protein SXG53_17310 [Pseudomonadota bacterium]|nr:hypothetical protein [Pseudomonadota bacterium]
MNQPTPRRPRTARLPSLALTLSFAAIPLASAQTNSPQAAFADPCAGNARCYSTGPIVAEVVQLASAQKHNNNHSVRVSVRIRNIAEQPIALAYKANSGSMLDNLGNQYKVDWRNDANVAGIGQVTKSQADPQFTLRPGEARTAVLIYSRYVGKTAIGTVFNPDLVVAQLQVLPGNQVRTVSEYSVSFANIAAGGLGDAVSSVDDAGRQLAEGLKSIFKSH